MMGNLYLSVRDIFNLIKRAGYQETPLWPEDELLSEASLTCLHSYMVVTAYPSVCLLLCSGLRFVMVPNGTC